jgi:hypothetical protein
MTQTIDPGIKIRMLDLQFDQASTRGVQIEGQKWTKGLAFGEVR